MKREKLFSSLTSFAALELLKPEVHRGPTDIAARMLESALGQADLEAVITCLDSTYVNSAVFYQDRSTGSQTFPHSEDGRAVFLAIKNAIDLVAAAKQHLKNINLGSACEGLQQQGNLVQIKVTGGILVLEFLGQYLDRIAKQFPERAPLGGEA